MMLQTKLTLILNMKKERERLLRVESLYKTIIETWKSYIDYYIEYNNQINTFFNSIHRKLVIVLVL